MKKTNIKAKKSARKDALPDNVDELKQLILAAQSPAEEQQNHIRRLEEIVKLFKANKFGKSSEKSPAQTELFDEAEIEGCDSDQNLFAEAIESEEPAQYLLQVLRKRTANRSLKISLELSSNMI
jgi:transposase